VLALLGNGTLGERESRSRSSERGLGVTRSEGGNRYSEGCRGLPRVGRRDGKAAVVDGRWSSLGLGDEASG
jgi:hypothetical protein